MMPGYRNDNFFKTFCKVFLCVLMLAFLFGGCTSKEEKVQKHMSRADKYLEDDRFKEAVIELKNVVQLDPKYADGHYRLGEVYLKMQKIREAFQSFYRTADIQPNNTKAQLKLSEIYLLGRKFEDARERAEIVLEEEP
ncbi:MAG: tetratricopeptide repeat protein, partial [Desulfobacterales bacterium]|nr:tetratricopeptide repeat protein [Desulfobacterales bacterium]